MYTTAATEAFSFPVPCHDGSTVLEVQGHQGSLVLRVGRFDSLVVLSSVSGSVDGWVGEGRVTLGICDGGRSMSNHLEIQRRHQSFRMRMMGESLSV